MLRPRALTPHEGPEWEDPVAASLEPRRRDRQRAGPFAGLRGVRDPAADRGAGPAGERARGIDPAQDPQVTPTSGHPSTAITFSVTYRDFEGSGPDYVRVIVGGDTYDLAPGNPGDNDWKHGVSYSRTMHLPVGDWPVTFESRGRDKFTSTFDGPTVSITPKPDPTPDPTPKPTPKPTPQARPHAASHAQAGSDAGPDAQATPRAADGHADRRPDRPPEARTRPRRPPTARSSTRTASGRTRRRPSRPRPRPRLRRRSTRSSPA